MNIAWGLSTIHQGLDLCFTLDVELQRRPQHHRQSWFLWYYLERRKTKERNDGTVGEHASWASRAKPLFWYKQSISIMRHHSCFRLHASESNLNFERSRTGWSGRLLPLGLALWSPTTMESIGIHRAPRLAVFAFLAGYDLESVCLDFPDWRIHIRTSVQD